MQVTDPLLGVETYPEKHLVGVEGHLQCVRLLELQRKRAVELVQVFVRRITLHVACKKKLRE